MRKVPLVTGEYYHVFNRGIDRRQIVQSNADVERLLLSISEFNTKNPIGSIFERSHARTKIGVFGDLVSKGAPSEVLVDVVCYCLLPNHYHIVMRQTHDKGIQKFMHRLGLGYTMYFNEKYRRSGSLFQGTYKANHIDSHEYLLNVSAYVNLNNSVHKKWPVDSPLIRSSWNEYQDTGGEYPTKTPKIQKDIVLDSFKHSSEYAKFASDVVASIREIRGMEDILSADEIDES